jgi:colanic acid/amylovoran biosynthesis glycosyltransferase
MSTVRSPMDLRDESNPPLNRSVPARASSAPVVLHSFPVWLPQTLTWLYSQVADSQALGINAHVACQHTENLAQFRVDNIHSAQTASPASSVKRAGVSSWMTEVGVRLVHSHVGNVLDRHLGGWRERPHAKHVHAVGQAIGADIVHSHFGNVGWSNLAAVRALRAKHVVTFYGMDVNKLPRSPVWRRRYRELFAEVDRVLCEGSYMAQSLIALGCPANKVKVQHLGVDITGIPFQPRRWQPGEVLKVLIAASFREKKGIPDAIEALGILRKRVPLELTIIGDAGPEADAREQKQLILAALSRTGLLPHTRMLGYQPHATMLAEAQSSHVFLHPSLVARDGDSEGGAPVCITEMLASGMPVVSTLHCDIPEVVGPKLAHLLAPEHDVPALVNRLDMLLADHTQWDALTQAGRERVETEYQRGLQARRLKGHHLEVLSLAPKLAAPR